jgi:hypothetical protein
LHSVAFLGSQVNVEDAELLTAWQRKREEYKQRKKVAGSRERDTLAKLKAYQESLKERRAKAAQRAPAPSADEQPGTSGRAEEARPAADR